MKSIRCFRVSRVASVVVLVAAIGGALAPLTLAGADCAAPPAGLVSWWRGENSTADAANENNGAWAGFGTTATYAPGMAGQAFVFDGTHRDRVDLGNPASLQLQTMTIEAWIKRSSSTVTSFDILGADGSVAGEGAQIVAYGRNGYAFTILNNGVLVFGKVDVDMIVSTNAVLGTNWHHVAVTVSGSNVMFYLDGAPASALIPYHSAFVFDTSVAIGSRGDARGGTFFGLIDEPALYNRVLTAGEIQTIYNAGSAGKCEDTPSVTCVAAPSGLVSWWKGEANAFDQADGNHGTLAGNTTYGIGRVGQGFVFDGNGDGVRVGNATNLHLQNFTIEAWIKRASSTAVSTSPCGNGLIFGYGGGGYALYLETAAGSLRLTRVDVDNVSSGVNISDTNWHHVAVAKSGSTVVFYVDGTAYAAPPYASTFTFGTPAAIGARGDNLGCSFFGRIDDVSVYNRALAAGEVQAIYNAGSAGKCFVADPPLITSQPASQTVVEGEEAHFTVAATGTSPLSYQWQFNGANIAGATGTSLTLLNVQRSQAGRYSVVVSNTAGTAPSLEAILTVNPAPPCAGPAPGLVSWWKGEQNSLDQTGGNHGTNAGNTTFGPGRVGQAFVLDGNGDAVRVGNPTNLQLQNFTIEAWIKRASATAVSASSCGNGLIFGYGGGGYALYLETAAGSLRLTRVDVDNVSSGVNIRDTNWHHVAVAKSGSTVVFYVDGTAYAAPPYTSTFTFGTPAAIGARGDNLGCSFLGRIDEVSVYNRALSAAEIQAIYATGVSGKCFGPPTIVTQPVSQRVTVGADATFSVLAEGAPPLHYQWRFNGDDIAGATDSTLSFVVSDASGGLYSVRVTNRFGAVISSNALLTVNHPPVADASATRLVLIVPAGCPFTVVLDASRSSDPDGDPLTYLWFKGGETNAFATGIVAVATLSLGTHSVTLVTDDGLATDAQSFSVELITPAQAVERLMALVSAQAENPNPLLATLSGALGALTRGNVTPAFNTLLAFQHQVRAQVSPGNLAQAAQFIQRAQEILDALTRDCASVKPRGNIGRAQRDAGGKFTLEISGTPGQIYLIEASSDLVNWEIIGVAADRGGGTFVFEDAGASRQSTRFYRIVVP